jgi:serine/threonine protein kinase
MMVLQYANQGNLREYLKRNFKLLQWTDKIQMALDIARGLKTLHSRNIVHRDLVKIKLFIIVVLLKFSIININSFILIILACKKHINS